MRSVATPFVGVIVDDNAGVRRAIASLCRSQGIKSIGYSNYGEAIVGLEELGVPPLLLVLDYILDKGRTGLELAAEVRHRYGQQRTIAIITGYDVSGPSNTDYDILLGKPIHKERFVSLVRVAMLRQLHVARFLVPVLDHLAQRHELSTQELRVLALMSGGSTRSSLPADLALSPNTVKYHVRNTIKKLGCRTSHEIPALILRHASLIHASSDRV